MSYSTPDTGNKPMLGDGNAPSNGAAAKGKALARTLEEGHVCQGSHKLTDKFWTNGPSDISGGHGGDY